MTATSHSKIIDRLKKRISGLYDTLEGIEDARDRGFSVSMDQASSVKSKIRMLESILNGD